MIRTYNDKDYKGHKKICHMAQSLKKSMGGASLAKMVEQKGLLSDGFRGNMVKTGRFNVGILEFGYHGIGLGQLNVNILRPENSKTYWKLLWQAMKLVWQKTKLVGQLPHQLYRKPHPWGVVIWWTRILQRS